MAAVTTTHVDAARRARVLAFHGWRTSASILQQQVSELERVNSSGGGGGHSRDLREDTMLTANVQRVLTIPDLRCPRAHACIPCVAVPWPRLRS